MGAASAGKRNQQPAVEKRNGQKQTEPALLALYASAWPASHVGDAAEMPRAGLSPRGPAPPAAALSPGGSRRLSLGDARSSGGSVTGAITRGGVSTSPPGRPLFGSRTFPWRRPKSQPIPAPGRHVQGRGTACWTLTRPTLRPARGPPAGSTRHARPPRARRAAAPAGEVASGVVRPCGRPP